MVKPEDFITLSFDKGFKVDPEKYKEDMKAYAKRMKESPTVKKILDEQGKS